MSRARTQVGVDDLFQQVALPGGGDNVPQLLLRARLEQTGLVQRVVLLGRESDGENGRRG